MPEQTKQTAEDRQAQVDAELDEEIKWLVNRSTAARGLSFYVRDRRSSPGSPRSCKVPAAKRQRGVRSETVRRTIREPRPGGSRRRRWAGNLPACHAAASTAGTIQDTARSGQDDHTNPTRPSPRGHRHAACVASLTNILAVRDSAQSFHSMSINEGSKFHGPPRALVRLASGLSSAGQRRCPG